MIKMLKNAQGGPSEWVNGLTESVVVFPNTARLLVPMLSLIKFPGGFGMRQVGWFLSHR